LKKAKKGVKITSNYNNYNFFLCVAGHWLDVLQATGWNWLELAGCVVGHWLDVL